MEFSKPETVKLEGRRILLISPRFFGYEGRIAEQLESRGAKVTFVDDRPSNSTLSKILIRLSSAFIQRRLEAYHRSEIERLEGRAFDDILFIEPESCSTATIKRYKKAFPGARLILYMWDSFENKAGHVRGSLNLFDRTFSFDRSDSKEYAMSFRPLFFGRGFCPPMGESGNAYGLSFIGTIHSDRFRILKALKTQAEQTGIPVFIYPYLPSRLIFWLYKLTKREFWNVDQEDFRFDSLPYTEVLRVMSGSIAVVDIEHPGQRGLTMRTLEVIGACKKLITTNREVIHYPFYSPDRIQVIDRQVPMLAADFLKTPAEPLPSHLLAKYSLDEWINDLFGVSAWDSMKG